VRLCDASRKTGGTVVKIGDVEVMVQTGDVAHILADIVVASVIEFEEQTVRMAARNALREGQEKNAGSVVFGPLCDIEYRQPAAKILAQEILRYVNEFPSPSVRRITIVVPQEAYGLFARNVEGYLTHMLRKGIEGPYLTVDGIVSFDNGIVLIERSNPPLGWALPGGFVDHGETVEEAVVREIKEETGLDFQDIRLAAVISSPDRDPRFHTVSVVFVGRGEGVLRAGDDAQGAQVYRIDELPANIAFDHRDVIKRYA
jgi:8-oxo-dGTP diphosphatase